jgi:tRNA(Ile)-lysidine synthase
MDIVFEKFIRAIRDNQLLGKGERVLLAISGGADSVAMLRLFLAIRQKWQLDLVVAHYNHKLRAKESDDDEAFVRQLAMENGLECNVAVNVDPTLNAQAGNLEERARESRYAFFTGLAQQLIATKVALGHTMNDQAETILMRLLRGTGSTGLAGIPVAREQMFIRPLLFTGRDEIRGFLERHQQSWREDASNADWRFLRNRMRHDLLPKLQQDYNPKIIETLSNTARVLSEEADALQQLAREFVVAHAIHETPGRLLLPAELLRAQPRGLGKLILRETLRLLGSEDSAGSSLHLETIYDLLSSDKSGRSFEKGEVTVSRQFQTLCFEKADSAKKADLQDHYELPVPGEVKVPEAGVIFRTSLDGETKGPTLSQGLMRTIFLTEEEARAGLVVRSWLAGDAYLPAGSRTPKKVKELFWRKKIPRRQRENWPVLTTQGRIVFARGFPVSMEFQETRAAVGKLRVLVEEIELIQDRRI